MNESKIESLDTALPKEIVRCLELLDEYEAIGSAGVFEAAIIEVDLNYAMNALISDSVIKKTRAYTNLQKCQ